MEPWYYEEKEQLSLIREGNADASFRAPAAAGVAAAPSPEEARARVLSFVTLASRAAIDSGVEPSLSLELAARFAAQARAAVSARDLLLLSQEVRRSFAEEVACVRRETSGYSADVSACLSYLLAHLEDDATIQEASAATGHTPYYLSRKFRRETGRTFAQMLTEKRIERARRLLLYTDLTAAQISSLLRFSDPSHFGRCFRRSTGLSPGQFRNRRGGKPDGAPEP